MPDSISIVVPVYRGAQTLERLVAEIEEERRALALDDRPIRIDEVVLVHDCGPDDSARVMQALEEQHEWVRSVWLARNFGQHPATVAGISATTGDWVVTMDEDGMHDPGDVASLVETARSQRVALAYAVPSSPPPHGWYRNATSAMARAVFRMVSDSGGINDYTSFRAICGARARTLAAYCGHDVYLDVALTWVVDETTTLPVDYRQEGRASGYRFQTLLSHFRRLVVSSGTRPLRLIALLGLLATVIGLALAVVLVIMRLFSTVEAAGWTSVMLAITVFSGLILLALGIVAEYLSVAVTMAAGRPLYVTRDAPPVDS